MTNVIKITQILFKNSLPLQKDPKKYRCLTWICSFSCVLLLIQQGSAFTLSESALSEFFPTKF